MASDIVSYSYDQTIKINSEAYEMILAEVDDQILRSVLSGDPNIALDFGYQIMGVGHVRLIQLAKLFYELSDQWNSF